ncbi:beta-N-acetylhexosaminidase [Sunxiuqinia sp. sy24]|uniref:beta-N-acetylhexosaminidase n=1 Tax=Sunxiuqinia sp. sy24 TaxID=3461495 RepID=UPI0040453A6F
MKKLILILFILCAVQQIWAQEIAYVIPAPTSSSMGQGQFQLHAGLRIQSYTDFAGEIYFLQKELLRYQKLSSTIVENSQEAEIVLEKQKLNNGQLYELIITPNQITIQAESKEGAFYGIISLLQLANNSQNNSIACVNISDNPAYGWRGVMLDESRHFFGKEKVKSLLDWMAYYKLNRFHWHLTDEPGWRVEILNYPKLAEVGGVGNHSDKEAACQYYSQEDIKEIVAYASERHIVIIPEIDMPGHATAANRAYPEFSGGGSEKYPDFTFHPAKEGTYQYLTNILREVDALFPSQMIHVGGDEVSFGNHQWKTDAAVQQLMKTEKLADLKAVEDLFMRRMSDSILNMNNQVLVWDEMANAGLPKDNSIIFWWRHDQPKQLELGLKNGHKTVICPRLPLYFDFVQHPGHKVGRRWAGGFNQLENVYTFSVDQLPVSAKEYDLVLGFQANLWTETVDSVERFDFLLFPRLAAMAESVWSDKSQKDYADFLERLKPHLKQYQEAGLYYFNPFDVDEHPEPVMKK